MTYGSDNSFPNVFSRVSAMLRFALLCLVLTPSFVAAEDLWLATATEYPGRLRLSEGSTVPRVIFSRSDRPNPAYPDAIMKVGQIAVSVDQQVYYCSGLDGSLMHLMDGRHEIQPFTFPGQIRDLGCTSEPHTIYFSVVPTPRDGQPLADGVIYRRDFWEGTPNVVATIRQSDVGNNWWGTFTIKDSEIFLATLDSPSKLFRWAAGSIQPVYVHNSHQITGMTTGPGGEFIFTDGTGVVRRTYDFTNYETMLSTGMRLSDVAHRAPDVGGRP
jgi:hypothetical protein